MMAYMGQTGLSCLTEHEIKSEEPRLAPACPLCDCLKAETIARHSDFEGVFVFRCIQCSHHFAYPEPDSKRLALYYGRAYRKYRFGPSYYELMRRRAESQVHFIKRYLGTLAGNFAEWKICDIGCGIGALVAQFQREGALVKGYDPDPAVIKFGKKHRKSNLHVAGLEAANLCVHDYDLLCLSHVIEHLPDIRNSVGKALDGLRHDGFVFIEVPRYHEKMLHSPLDLESHLHFFTPKSLTTLLKGLGLHMIACATCGPIEHPAPNRKGRGGSRAAAMIGGLWNRILVLLNQRNRIKTIYDGFYESYYQTPEEGGIWIRCLAAKKEEQDGSAGSHSC